MEPSIQVLGAFFEVVKISMGSTEPSMDSAFCSSFRWLPPTSIDFRLLPLSLHMLASATINFRLYRRGGGRAAHSLVKYKLHFRTGWAGKVSRAHGYVPSWGFEREKRKTAELHTSGAKRVKTWRRGAKWELATGLAVASGGEMDRRKAD